jgi:hypothetical protein
MAFEQGETFEAFFSNRFRPADLTALLEQHGFYGVVHTETLPDQEGIWSGILR